jgi:hypothetical protein
MAMVHAQCAKKLSRLQSFADALMISCELVFTRACLQHSYPRVRVRRTYATWNTKLHDPFPPRTDSVNHGCHQQRQQPQASDVEGYHNDSNASNALTLWWPASTVPTVATSGSKFSECINTSVACIYFSNCGNKRREILKSSSGMKTFDQKAFDLHGSHCMLTHFSASASA